MWDKDKDLIGIGEDKEDYDMDEDMFRDSEEMERSEGYTPVETGKHVSATI